MEDKNKEKINVVELFGSNVFNDKIMQERLPKKVQRITHTGSSRLLDSQQKNMMHLLQHRMRTERSAWTFPEKS